MRPWVWPLPGNEAFAETVAAELGGELLPHELRPFPDGETYLRADGDVAGRPVVLVCTLDRPDPKVVPLAMAAATARDLGASQVGLVAPYLCYLRQDIRFQPGEGVTSAYFGRFLSPLLDWVATVDPHLHRYDSLGEVYDCDAEVVAAAPALAEWITANVQDPFLIGPDAESAQWVGAVGAAAGGVPHAVLEKVRHGDTTVEIRLPAIEQGGAKGRQPVLVDDIISTAGTAARTAILLQEHGLPAPVCVGVHGIFAGEAEQRLRDAGVKRIVTTNTIPTAHTAIDVAPLMAAAVRRLAGL
ncbi:MAG: ribose-phosphate diphosphokinase [Planctomycetota bacterium]|jgi:ribose-phosphate pyrophosphokinase